MSDQAKEKTTKHDGEAKATATPDADETVDQLFGEETVDQATEQASMVQFRQQQMQRRSKYEPQDFEQLMRYADYIHKASLCPRHVKSAADVMLIVQQGTELGLSPMMALQNLYSIDGKVTLPAKIKIAIIKSSPACKYFRRIHADGESATYDTWRVGQPEPVSLTYTIDQAKSAGLTRKDNWKNYPAAMLRARVKSQLADDVYEDILAGIYTPDEVGAVTDGEGIPLFDQGGNPIVSRAGGVKGSSKKKPHEWHIDDDGDGKYGEVEGDKWTGASKRYYKVLSEGDFAGVLKTLIKQRHGVDSWKQIPAFVINWWSTAVEKKGATPVAEWLAEMLEVEDLAGVPDADDKSDAPVDLVECVRCNGMVTIDDANEWPDGNAVCVECTTDEEIAAFEAGGAPTTEATAPPAASDDDKTESFNDDDIPF